PSSVEEGADERDDEDEQRPRLGRRIIAVEDTEEQEDQDPEHDVARDPSLREIEDPAHSLVRSSGEDKKPSVPVARMRPFQKYIAREGVCEAIPHVRPGRV